jgi:hypothetical protein
MAKLPPIRGSDALANIKPAWRVVRSRTALFRVYARGGDYPTHWDEFRFYGPTGSRFDHHLEPPHVQSRGIFYAARAIETPFAEFFQTRRTIDVHQDEPWLVGFRLAQSLKLLNIRGRWPTRAGASTALNSGSRKVARGYARAIYAAYPEAQGIWYGSSMNANSPCIALFERAAGSFAPRPAFHHALADPLLLPLLDRCAAAFNYALVL